MLLLQTWVLSTLAAIDGVTPVLGDRILVKDQTTQSANGIYLANSGAWTRALDFDNWLEIPGGYAFVEEGTTQADTGWVCTSNTGGTLGTTAVTWVQFTGLGQVTDGIGLLKTGNVLDVRLDNSTIEAPADILQVKDLGITGAKLATSAVDLAGTKVTGQLGLANGGTGGATALAARLNLSITSNPLPSKYAALVGALTAGVAATITHGLNTQDVVVSFRDATTNRAIEFDWTANGLSTIQVTADIAYAANALRVTVIG